MYRANKLVAKTIFNQIQLTRYISSRMLYYHWHLQNTFLYEILPGFYETTSLSIDF